MDRNTYEYWYCASTKTLSKAANHIAKKEKSGVVNLINSKQTDELLMKLK